MKKIRSYYLMGKTVRRKAKHSPAKAAEIRT
jgi:hypothetical protein